MIKACGINGAIASAAEQISNSIADIVAKAVFPVRSKMTKDPLICLQMSKRKSNKSWEIWRRNAEPREARGRRSATAPTLENDHQQDGSFTSPEISRKEEIAT